MWTCTYGDTSSTVSDSVLVCMTSMYAFAILTAVGRQKPEREEYSIRYQLILKKYLNPYVGAAAQRARFMCTP